MTYPSDPYQPPTGEQPQQPNPYGQVQPQYTQPYAQPQPYGQYGYPQQPQQQEQSMAIASLVCSLAGIFFCLPAVLGIIFGHVGYSKAKRGEAGGQGMAQAGMTIGYVVCGLWAILFLLWLGLGLVMVGSIGVS